MSMDQQPAEKKGGYTKRPWWQWAILYIVVAVVVYLVVYWILFHHAATAGY